MSQRWAAEAAAAAHPTGVPRSLSVAMERIDEDGPALLGRGERRGPAGAHPLRVGAEGGRGRRGGAPVGRAAELERNRGADRQGRGPAEEDAVEVGGTGGGRDGPTVREGRDGDRDG